MSTLAKRPYYSTRIGKIQPNKIDFETAKRLFVSVYNRLWSEGYFQEYFGIDCADEEYPGKLGPDIEAVMIMAINKPKLYPVHKYIDTYYEDDFFDVIEFLHDHCSKGSGGFYHDWNNCGNHYSQFDGNEGQAYFRDLINPILRIYQEGFEISRTGEILIMADDGLSAILEANVPSDDSENITAKISAAIVKFRRQKSSPEDRKDALRELVDVLEFLRIQAKDCLDNQDEKDLFNVANNFGIRHHNSAQKTNYDKAIWYSWMFYYYLSTIHALLRLIEKKAGVQTIA